LNISVLGCGRWGTFLAWYCSSIGHDVLIWGRENSRSLLSLQSERKNTYLQLQDSIILTTSLEDALNHGDYIIISISAQELRGLVRVIADLGVVGKTFILCMKGIEDSSGKRLSQIMTEELETSNKIAIWVGPGHVQDFISGIPNCMLIDSVEINTTREIARNVSSDLIRFYYGEDLIENEIGAAAKNVMGIAAGMLDGFCYSSLKGALMARGAREISRLVNAMGGKEITPYGLSHLGDYEATLFSQYSHNRKFGEMLVKGDKFDKLAEGVSTSKALVLLARDYNVELPICAAVNDIVNNGAHAKEVLLDLFLRPIKRQF